MISQGVKKCSSNKVTHSSSLPSGLVTFSISILIGFFRIMDQSLFGDVVKTQDLPHIIVYVAKNPSGYHLAWTFLKENWNKLVQK